MLLDPATSFSGDKQGSLVCLSLSEFYWSQNDQYSGHLHDCVSDHKLFIAKERKKVKLLSRIWLFATPWTVLPGSSIRGLFQARILEWVATSFSRRSSQPRDWTQVSCIVDRLFTVWATWEILIAKLRLKFKEVGENTRPLG